MSPQKKNYGGLTSATCCFLLITILSSLNVVYSARMARNKDEVTVVPPNHHYLGNDGLIATKKNIATAEVGGAQDEISQAGKELLVEVINNNAQTMADLNQDDPEMLKKIASVNGIKITQDKKTGKNTYSVNPEGKSFEDLEKILNEVDKFSTQKGFAAVSP